MSPRAHDSRPPHRWAVAALGVVALCIGVLTLSPVGRADPAAAATSSWQTVACLTCSRAWLTDVISNVALFLPLGAAFVAVGVSVRRAVVIGAAASLLIEMLQLSGVAGGRTPAIADLVSNTLGTWAGSLLAVYAPSWVSPSVPLARALRNGWAVICGATWIAIACALQPATPVQPRAAVSPSAVPFTPGYGWFTAEAMRTDVNDVMIAHHGNGPVLVATRRSDSSTARVTVRGRDTRSGIVPVVFVHEPAMTGVDPSTTRAHLLLGQHDQDASLASDLRAAHWGLQLPDLRAPGAFAPGRDSVRLEAAVTTRWWRLVWFTPSEPGRRHEAALRLSPAIGWALVQSIVPMRAVVGELLTAVWLFVWFAPLGYWSASTSHARSAARTPRVMQCLVAVAWAGGLLAVGWVAAEVTGTSPVSLAQGAWCVLSAVVGAGLRSLVGPVPLRHRDSFERDRSD